MIIEVSGICGFVEHSNFWSLSYYLWVVLIDSLLVRSLSRFPVFSIYFGKSALGLKHYNMDLILLVVSLKIIGAGFGCPAIKLPGCYACSKFLISSPEPSRFDEFADFLASYCYYDNTRGASKGLETRLWPNMKESGVIEFEYAGFFSVFFGLRTCLFLQFNAYC